MPQINLVEFPVLFQIYDTHETLIGGTGVPALGVWALPAGALLLLVARARIGLRGRL